MSNLKKAIITAFGSYLPERVVTNQDIEKIVDTTDEWITKRTGIKERRFARKDESAATLGIGAALKALEKAGRSAQDLDLIIVATMTPDYICPATATLIQSGIKANCPAFDIGAACSGFLYGLSIAKAFIESGAYRRILFIATEKMTSFLNFEDRSSCILFGDGAAACIIESEGNGLQIEDVILGADGYNANLITIPAGGSKEPADEHTFKEKKHYLALDGKEVFKHAVRRMKESLEQCFEKNGISLEDVAYIVPHQANSRIIDAIVKNLNCPEDKVWVTVERIANTSASSIGLALDDLLSKKVLAGESLIALTAFGAGLTFGSALLKQTEKQHG